MKKAKGRMLNRDMSGSDKIASLSPKALALFCLLIPHFNAHGKQLGGPGYIKDVVCPKIPWLIPRVIVKCLQEITAKTNVKWFKNNGFWYIQSLNWGEHQDLKSYRKGEDDIPNWDNSGSSPGVVPTRPLQEEVEVKVEVKEEVEVKVKGKAGVVPDLSGKRPARPCVSQNLPYQKIIDHLNQKAGTAYKPTSRKTQELIQARFNEGFTLEKFQVVINNQVEEWLNTDMAKYLRPETLFGPKFEGYLNKPKKVQHPGIKAFVEEGKHEDSR